MSRTVEEILDFAYHEGERYLHQKSQVTDLLAAEPGSTLRSYMPQQHRDFYEMLPYLILGTRDPETNRVWASMIAAPEGKQLASTPSNTQIDFQTSILKGDPLAAILEKHHNNNQPSSPLLMGMLGIELPTRRRNRANGKVYQVNKAGFNQFQFSMNLDVAFGNCPKYIQTRKVSRVPNPSFQDSDGSVINGSLVLSEETKKLVQNSDTFFWATSNIPSSQGYSFDKNNRKQGVDVSHRGGKPGFVKVSESKSKTTLQNCSFLTFPDYIGNFMFQTLGNIHVNPQCGLLFMDFDSGDVLYLSGKAYIDFDDLSMPGSHRMVNFYLEDYIFSKKSLPFHYEFLSNSIYLPEIEKTPGVDSKFGLKQINVTCVEIKQENYNTKTYTFGAKLAIASNQKPGQFATFDLMIDNQIVTRTWTISSAPAGAGEYTISITVKMRPEGLASKWMWKNMSLGDEIILKGIEGTFTYDCLSHNSNPVIFFAGGIGITPFISMLRGLRNKIVREGLEKEDIKKESERRIDLYYSAREENDFVFLRELLSLTHFFPSFYVHLFLSSSSSNYDNLERVFKSGLFPHITLNKGRITSESVSKLFTGNLWTHSEAMICGPERYMQNVQLLLESFGLSKGSVHLEAFNF